MIEKAKAAAGAMCVTDWKNTSRRPIASRLRPGSAGAVVVVVVPGAFGAEPSIASLYGEPNFDYPLGEVHSRKGLAQIAGSDDRAGVRLWPHGRQHRQSASASRGEDERCTGR